MSVSLSTNYYQAINCPAFTGTSEHLSQMLKLWISIAQYSQYILVGIPKFIKTMKEESTPLPDPFPLLTNFRPDVHLCLAKKKLTKSSRAVFYTAVAAAMFQYKRYPSRDNFISIARQIIAKYPFSWIKEFRSKSCKKFTCLLHACTAFPDGGFPFFPFSHL